MSHAIANLSPDRSTVTHSRGAWSNTFPASELPAQLAFYEQLQARRGGAYADSYESDVIALRGVARLLKANA